MSNINDAKKRSDELHGTHKFLAEELLIPNLNKCDTTRVNMFCNHIVQALILKEGEYPKVFTNFENQIGKYSSSFKVSDDDYTVVGIIKKNKMNTVTIVKNNDNYIDMIFNKKAENITEHYGYVIENKIKKLVPGDKINKGDLIYRSTSYDDELNFKYGRNLRAVYLSFDNMTYEDAIIISESAAKKLTSYNVEEVVITLNNNDILINMYGDDNTYKCFPDIGENVVDSMLASRRRINYDSLLYDLSLENISVANEDTDTIFYLPNGSKIIDIDVFYNNKPEILEKYSYNQQINKYYLESIEFYKNIYSILDPYINDPKYTTSDDVNFWYERAKCVLDPEFKWRNDGTNVFDNLIIKVTTVIENPLVIGCKLTGRYGNKGVVSKILPDDQMPKNQYGETAEIILNPLGVIGRLNIAQLYEQELNFMAANLVRELKEEMNGKYSKFNVKKFFRFLKIIAGENTTYYDFMLDKFVNSDKAGKRKFIDEVLEHGIFIHQPPFFGNITFDNMEKLYEEFGYEPYEFTYNGQKIVRPLIMGELYYIRLKHDPKSKFSARSSGYLNINGVPGKTTKYKLHQAPYSNTPIKNGEMEFFNMALTQDIEKVKLFVNQYSANSEDRKNLIKKQLTENVFNMEDVGSMDSESITSLINKTYLRCAGIEILK